MIQSIEEGRKEDGNRSIAGKIIKRLNELEKTIESNFGRWAWELLQNAKDSIADDDSISTVSVEMELRESELCFRHNGSHFTEKDIRGLINQISSKEVEEDEESKKTGRFGTGFLTTHMLSKLIHIQGVLEAIDGKFYSFEFPLDRTEKTTKKFVPKIEKSWESFHESATEISSDYDKSLLNTAFRYPILTDSQKFTAKKGIEEFSKLIPYVLTFIPSINEVKIIDRIEDKTTLYKKGNGIHGNSITTISKIVNEAEPDYINILYKEKHPVSIAVELEVIDGNFHFKKIEDIPKLFCDFPLIGSEKFHVPMIINSFNFNPLTERDGIWLKGDSDKDVLENKELIVAAINLYKNLLEDACDENYYQFYNIINTKMPSSNDKSFDSDWYRRTIQKPLKEFILNKPIVELEDDKDTKKPLKKIYFTENSYPKEIQTEIWKYTYDLCPTCVCKEEQIFDWGKKYWDGWKKLTYPVLVSTISKKENVENLAETLGLNESDTIKWLNRFCMFILKDESNSYLFDSYAIIPNQNGEFRKRSKVSIDEINDNQLLDILILLGDNWKDILLHKDVLFGKYTTKKKRDIADAITGKLNGSRRNIPEYNKAIISLSEWFEENESIAKGLFSEWYRKRAQLFMNTIKDKDSLYKVMKSKTDLAELSKVAMAIDNNPKLLEGLKANEELSSLLTEFNVESVSELKKLLIISKGIDNIEQKLEMTEEVLLSLGVTSKEELEEALKDKNIAAQFSHSSTPNAEMFLYVQKLITRAKENVIKHLKSQSKYDCSDLEELAPTVIGGIMKEGLEMIIVVRPSDNGEVIIYYSSEKDTLDYEDAELWIDNGKDTPRHLTLGKILKTTGINKIPV